MDDGANQPGDHAPDDLPAPPPEAPFTSGTWVAAPEPHAATGTAGRRRRRLGAVAAVAVAGVLVLGGVAFAAAMFVLRGSPEQMTSRVPADSDFFVTAYLDPSAAQKIALHRVASSFPALGTNAGTVLDRALDPLLAPAGIDAGDIHPWLGSQVAVAGRADDSGVSVALLIDSSDDAAARATIDRVRTHGEIAGQRYSWTNETRDGATLWVGRPQFGGTPIVLGLDGGTVLVSNSIEYSSAIASTIAGDAPALASDSGFTTATATLPSDRLALGYVHVASVYERLAPGLTAAGMPGAPLEAGGLGSPSDPRAIVGLGASISATNAGLEADVATTIDPSKLTPRERATLGARPTAEARQVLTSVPANAYGVLSIATTRGQIESALHRAGLDSDQGLAKLGLTGPDGVLAHLTGGAALEVEPGADRYPTGAVIIGTDDPAGMRSFLDRAANQLAASLSAGLVMPTAVPRGSASPGVLPSVGSASRTVRSWQSSTYRGTAIRTLVLPGVPTAIQPSYAVDDDTGILGASPAAVRDVLDARAGANLTGSPGYQRAVAALGRVDDEVLYVDADSIVAAVDDALAPEERSSFDQRIAPNVRPIDALVIGGRSSVPVSTTRMVLLVR
jgi:Protein of unknown function (DUF3352)